MKFLILGNFNACCWKDVFPLLKANKVWLGASGRNFYFSTDEGLKLINACWLTNLEHNQKNKPIHLTKNYTPDAYPKYDNYSAVECSKAKDIPYDYEGVIGVPLTFLTKYCTEQFEIIGIACGNSWANYPETLKSLRFNPDIKYGGGLGTAVLNGKAKYTRLFIRRKRV